MSKKKQKLIFIDRWSRRKMGASVMRVKQLSEHMKTFHADTYDIRILYLSRSMKPATRAWLSLLHADAVFVFSKYAAYGWNDDDLTALRRKVRGILIDYVDMPIAEMRTRGVDIHLSSSYTGARLMKTFMDVSAENGKPFSGRVETVLHNYDVAVIPPSEPLPSDHLAMAYLGSREMTRTTALTDEMVTFLDASTVEAFRANIKTLGQFNAHYCIRKSAGDEPGRVAKPFTKGATAAAYGAVILTDRGTDDAVEQLGDDYPFLVNDNSDASIDAGLRHMQEAFGGPEWTTALERIANVRRLTSHQAVAGQLHTAIQSLL